MQIPHVFIDSSIFIGNNYDYASKAFRQIVSLAEEERLFVFVTRIVVHEVESHIDQDVLKAQKAFDGFREKSDVRVLKNIQEPPLHGVFIGFDAMQAREVLLRQFHDFLQKAKVHVLEITGVSVNDVFERYFSQTPPFSTKKKDEFPDAFSLAAVEQWCKESSARMHVVSTDSDLQDACALNPSLKSVQSLSEFLDLLSRGEKLAELVNRLFEVHKGLILQNIQAGIGPLNLVYEPHGELQNAVVDSARIVKHYLIEVDEGKATFDVITEVSYSANVLYRNNALMLMMGVPGGRDEIEYGSTNVRAEVTLAFDEESAEVTVESVNVNHDSIHVFPNDDPEEFVRKFTNARRALYKHIVVIAQRMGGATWILTNTHEAILARFDEIKDSLPVQVMSDLQALSMLNSVTGSLNYHGATTIKDETSRRTNLSKNRLNFPFARELNTVTQNAFEATKRFDSSAIRHAIQNAELMNRSAVHQTIHQTIADSKLFPRSAVQQALENAQLFNTSAAKRAMEEATLFSRPAVQRAFENAALFSTSAVQRAIESHLMRYNNPLSGHSLPRFLLLKIAPKTSSAYSPDEAVRTVSVEVLRNVDVYGPNEVDDTTDESDWDETPPLEFNQSPVTINVNHHVGKSKPLTTQHKMRKATLAEWQQWSLNLQRSIRYLSQAEINEESGGQDQCIDSDSEVSTQSYSEWSANERLYDHLILEVAGFKLDNDDQFPRDQFRALPSETVKNLRTEIKTSVITKSYRCDCELERDWPSNGNEQSVRQYLKINSTSFNLRHILRVPTPDENNEFRTTIVRGSFSHDEDNREIIELKLNLATAVTFYDRLLIRIENGIVDGHPYQDATRESFLMAINPIYKLRVLEPLFDVNAWYFKIDDIIIP